MNPTKVTLSPKELMMVMDTDWILTKNAIMQKVCDLFGGLSLKYASILHKLDLPDISSFDRPSPKISKGEKYEGLPWAMLDYPRHYTKTDSFGVRSFFWWGNFCSISIQLSGTFQQYFVNSIQHFFQQTKSISNAESGWFICIGEDAWQHDFGKNNYAPMTDTILETLPQLPFIKLTKKIPLQEWDQLDSFFEKNYEEIILMLTQKPLGTS